VARDYWIAGTLTGLGLAGLIGLITLWSQGPAEKPAADGELGVVRVWGQGPRGPIYLRPNLPVVLPRPQALVFQLHVEKGTGPRVVRIELESNGETSTLFEEALTAPIVDTLEVLPKLEESAPDRLRVIVTIEAPHLSSVSVDYPIQLSGAETRFWDRDDAGGDDASVTAP
jgi:hypothetical protein